MAYARAGGHVCEYELFGVSALSPEIVKGHGYFLEKAMYSVGRPRDR